MLNQGILYSKIIKANEITLSHINKDQYFVFSFYTDKEIKSIVFSKKTENNQILQTIKYSDSLSVLHIDSIPRDKTSDEELYVKMYFNMYASSFYFPLPKDFWAIIENKGDRFDSYMIPQQNDPKIVMFGHDYLFTYKLNGDFKNFKFIHNNPIPIPAIKSSDDFQGTAHEHANRNSKFISAIDIANILVSINRIDWDRHIVISKKYVSIFDLKTKTLKIELKKDYENRVGQKLKN